MTAARSARGGLIAFAALALIASCGTDDGAAPAPPPGKGPGSESMVATYEATDVGGDAALLEGSLQALAGCLVIETDDGDVIVPVFPDRGVNDVTADRIVFEGETFMFGRRAAFTGGYVDMQQSSGLATMPAGCDGYDQFMVASTE